MLKWGFFFFFKTNCYFFRKRSRCWVSNTQSPTLAWDMWRTGPQEPCHVGWTCGDFRGDQDSPPSGFGFLSCEAPSLCPSAVQVQRFSERPSTGKRCMCQDQLTVWPAAHQHAPWSPSFLPRVFTSYGVADGFTVPYKACQKWGAPAWGNQTSRSTRWRGVRQASWRRRRQGYGRLGRIFHREGRGRVPEGE